MQTHVEQMQQAAHSIMKVGSLSWGSHRDVAFQGTYWIFVNLSTGGSMLGGISTSLFSLLEATLSNGYMISISGYSVDAQLELFAGFKSEVCSMSKLQLPEWTFPNTAIGIPKPNSRCSSLPSVSEVIYMEGFIYLQAEVAYCSWKDCMDFSMKVFSLWLVNMYSKWIKECLHVFSNRKCI